LPVSKVLLVGMGGFIGSVLRYWIGGLVQAAVAGSTFPFGTLAVNVTGCFAIGFLAQLGEAQSALTPNTRALLVVGLLGGYTTFSAFGNETVNLLRDGQRVAAAANVGGNLLLALCAVWLGRMTVHWIWR
jgi:fluoride exporter